MSPDEWKIVLSLCPCSSAVRLLRSDTFRHHSLYDIWQDDVFPMPYKLWWLSQAGEKDKVAEMFIEPTKAVLRACGATKSQVGHINMRNWKKCRFPVVVSHVIVDYFIDRIYCPAKDYVSLAHLISFFPSPPLPSSR